MKDKGLGADVLANYNRSKNFYNAILYSNLYPSAFILYPFPMGDLKSKNLIILKGFLFLLCGAVAAITLLAENWNWRNALLLAIAIWSFCRFYYFAFYVIEKYVDPTYKFSSLWSFARYWFKKRAQ